MSRLAPLAVVVGFSLLSHRTWSQLTPDPSLNDSAAASKSTRITVSPQPRCDCAYNKIQGSCTAIIERKKDWVSLSTPAVTQCASVVWDINGFAQVSVVTDGHLQEPLVNVPNNAKIEVRSCKVCQDSSISSTDNVTGGNNISTPSRATLSTASGTWSGYTTSIFGKQDATLAITVIDGRVSGTVSGPKESFAVTGTQSGSTLTLTCTTHDGLQTMTMQVDSSNKMQGTWRAGMFSGSMYLTKQ